MPPESLREFDRQLRAGIAVELTERGFVSGPGRTLRRVIEDDATRSTQIIEFQLGVRSLAGRFTVNLAVYNPEYLPAEWPPCAGGPVPADCLLDLRQRLGFFLSPKVGLLDRLLGRRREPYDHWWTHRGSADLIRAELRSVGAVLSTRGEEWLNTRSSVAGLEWAKRQLERRKAWKSAPGRPGSPHRFEPERFPVTV